MPTTPRNPLHGIMDDGLALTGPPEDGYRGQPRDATVPAVPAAPEGFTGFRPRNVANLAPPLTDRALTDLAAHADVDRQFRYHAPHDDQPERYALLREHARTLAHAIVDCYPPCADRTAAMRLLREAVMTANAAIAIQEAVPAAVPMPATQSTQPMPAAQPVTPPEGSD